MDKDKVLDLARLARVEMGNEEAEKLSREFEAILGYVGEVKSIKSATDEDGAITWPVRNVLREDGEPHAPGFYTEKILDLAPSRQDNFIKVKKIL